MISLVVSACLGALVGLIRQWSAQTEHKDAVDLGGVRTYTFWAILGCLGAALSPPEMPVMLIVVLALVGSHQLLSVRRTQGQLTGSTTFASALLTIMIGALVYWDQRQIAIVVAGTTMVMLGLKQPLHSWTRAFKPEDIRATLQFVAITGVILPLVPNRNFGPYDAFNPFSTWMMVVLISGLGFVGYIAMRLLGTRAGIILTSLFGGIASSTATTLAFTRRSKESPAMAEHYAMAVVIACSVMLPRVALTVWVLNPELGVTPVDAPQITNPLSLMTAVKFALLYALIGFLVKAALQFDLLHSGLLPLSFVSGLTDMDAIALSMADNVTSLSLTAELAAKAVVVAAVGNSLLKAGLAISLGAPKLRRDIAIVLGFTALAGIGGLWLI
jgi:uncharacterized membrane protein (DUF4010 family)